MIFNIEKRLGFYYQRGKYVKIISNVMTTLVKGQKTHIEISKNPIIIYRVHDLLHYCQLVLKWNHILLTSLAMDCDRKEHIHTHIKRVKEFFENH